MGVSLFSDRRPGAARTHSANLYGLRTLWQLLDVRPSSAESRPPDRRGPPPWVETLLGGLVATLPFVVAVWRASATAQWRADLAAVRDHGLVAVGVGGSLSTVATQAMGLLPIG